MKTTSLFTLVALSAMLASILGAQTGGPYHLGWSSIDSGGLTAGSTGGSYRLSGTIGQADAHPALTGGDYSLTGGFWSLLAVLPTPEAPPLQMELIAGGTQVVLSWEVTGTGWQLETSTDLQTWQASAALVVDTPTHHTVTLPAPRDRSSVFAASPQPLDDPGLHSVPPSRYFSPRAPGSGKRSMPFFSAVVFWRSNRLLAWQAHHQG